MDISDLALRSDSSSMLGLIIFFAALALIFILPWCISHYNKLPKVIIKKFYHRGKRMGLLQSELQQLLNTLLETQQLDRSLLIYQDSDFLERVIRTLCQHQLQKKRGNIDLLICYQLLRIFEKLSLGIQHQRQKKRRLLAAGKSIVYLVQNSKVRLKFNLVQCQSGQIRLAAPRSIESKIPLRKGRPWGGRECSLLVFPLAKHGRIQVGQGVALEATPLSLSNSGNMSFLNFNQLKHNRRLNVTGRNFRRRYSPELTAQVKIGQTSLPGRLLNLSTRGCALLVKKGKISLQQTENLSLQLQIAEQKQELLMDMELRSISLYRSDNKVYHLLHIRFKNIAKLNYLILANYVYGCNLKLDRVKKSQKEQRNWLISETATTSSSLHS